MIVSDLLEMCDVASIYGACSQFISDSAGLPLYKRLPTHTPDIARIKVRRRRPTHNLLSTVFHDAFESECSDIRERSVAAYPSPPTGDGDLFYVLPINEYQFTYNTNVPNSDIEMGGVVDVLAETLAESDARQVAAALIRSSYSRTNILEGMLAGAEVLLYRIPHFYAVRVRPGMSYVDTISKL